MDWQEQTYPNFAREQDRCLLAFLIYISSDEWGKIKHKLPTLPRIVVHVVCRFNSIAFSIQR